MARSPLAQLDFVAIVPEAVVRSAKTRSWTTSPLFRVRVSTASHARGSFASTAEPKALPVAYTSRR